MRIDSLQNERVKKWIKLHQKKYREKYDLFLIEEEHLISEANKKDIIDTLIILEGHKNIFNIGNTVYVNSNIMNKLSTNISSVKYIAVCKKIKESLNYENRILILDNIQDPGNMGTLIRSALSFGFNQIIASDNCVDIYNDKTLRATQGALFHVNFITGDLKKIVSDLKDNSYNVIALTLNNSIFLDELKETKKMAFVLGNEGSGIEKSLEDICDYRVKIEMSDFESLNVSIAGSIAMYKFRNI